VKKEGGGENPQLAVNLHLCLQRNAFTFESLGPATAASQCRRVPQQPATIFSCNCAPVSTTRPFRLQLSVVGMSPKTETKNKKLNLLLPSANFQIKELPHFARPPDPKYKIK